MPVVLPDSPLFGKRFNQSIRLSFDSIPPFSEPFVDLPFCSAQPGIVNKLAAHAITHHEMDLEALRMDRNISDKLLSRRVGRIALTELPDFLK